MSKFFRNPDLYRHTRAAIAGGLRIELRRVSHLDIEVWTAPVADPAKPLSRCRAYEVRCMWQTLRDACPTDPRGATQAFGIRRGRDLEARLREFLCHNDVFVVDLTGEGDWEDVSDSPMNSYCERRKAKLILESDRQGGFSGWILVEVSVRFHGAHYVIIDFTQPIMSEDDLFTQLRVSSARARVGDLTDCMPSELMDKLFPLAPE